MNEEKLNDCVELTDEETAKATGGRNDIPPGLIMRRHTATCISCGFTYLYLAADNAPEIPPACPNCGYVTNLPQQQVPSPSLF